jgi:hypothetical protein
METPFARLKFHRFFYNEKIQNLKKAYHFQACAKKKTKKKAIENKNTTLYCSTTLSLSLVL